MNYENKDKILRCKHEWVRIQLIVSDVFDCKKCGVHKEDWDNELHKEKISNTGFSMRMADGSIIRNDGGYGDFEL